MKKRYFVYISYLLMVTAIVTTVSLSRYASTMEGSDTAAVAKPVITYEPVSGTLNGNVLDISEGIALSGILPGDELIYAFNIKNFEGSERNQVTLKYSIVVSFDPSPLNMPLSYTVEPAEAYPSAGGDWTYLGFSEEETHSYTLTVSWDEADDDSAYQEQQQAIEIKIISEQVDSSS